ncbi:hypothetical protein N7475_007881, partial [Penicillium sp. IBT 31633x]
EVVVLFSDQLNIGVPVGLSSALEEGVVFPLTRGACFCLYLISRVSNDKTTGLCLNRYPYARLKEVNPQDLMKRNLRSIRQATGDYGYILSDIEICLAFSTENDRNAVEEICIWLSISSREYKFDA